MNIRLITIHDLRSKVHALWLVIIGRAIGVAEIIRDEEMYKLSDAEKDLAKEIYKTKGGMNGK